MVRSPGREDRPREMEARADAMRAFEPRLFWWHRRGARRRTRRSYSKTASTWNSNSSAACGILTVSLTPSNRRAKACAARDRVSAPRNAHNPFLHLWDITLASLRLGERGGMNMLTMSALSPAQTMIIPTIYILISIHHNESILDACILTSQCSHAHTSRPPHPQATKHLRRCGDRRRLRVNSVAPLHLRVYCRTRHGARFARWLGNNH
ncbi:hypothetical protein FIBSPDRAFT_484222 [Athelia psychrophila]|uniref:Uncharacterized protein n=1 Tax=Athelia psychrophila TaxID=1759441 RepID=A0A167TXN8_9AGAM|nr:hypothetical protein FIBSPDRAFT_484222 [Fibularhizoctonia sp. CBS 109695]